MYVRKIELVRAVWGAGLLVAPRWILTTTHRVTVDRPSVLIARVLGARQLSQAVLSGIEPSPEILATGVWVDAVHALSALGLAGVDHSRSRAGLTDATVAGAFAVLGWRDLQVVAVPQSSKDRRRDAMALWVLDRVPGGGPLRRASRARREGTE